MRSGTRAISLNARFNLIKFNLFKLIPGTCVRSILSSSICALLRLLFNLIPFIQMRFARLMLRSYVQNYFKIKKGQIGGVIFYKSLNEFFSRYQNIQVERSLYSQLFEFLVKYIISVKCKKKSC